MKLLTSLICLLVFNNCVLAKDLAQKQNAKSYKRIVALTSLSADLIVSLDREVLVGVPGTKLTNNDQRFIGIKRISSGRSQPNIESIVSLQPDLVVGATGFHSKTLSSLKRLGINTLEFRIDRWNKLEKSVDVLSSMIPNNGSLKNKINSICPKVSQSNNAKQKSLNILILAGITPKLSPAKQSWSGSLLQRMGLTNATDSLTGNSQFSGYITMSNERLLTIKPDIVLTINPSGGSDSQYSSLKKYFPNLNKKDFYGMDYYGLINPGSLGSIAKACSTLRQL